MPEVNEKHLKNLVSLLFSKYGGDEPADDLRSLEMYYRYLGERINSRKLLITADQELLEAFESVSLLLKEKLLLYPETVRDRVFQIFEDEKLLQTFSVLSSISLEDVKFIRFGSWLDLVFPPSKRNTMSPASYWFTPRILMNMKIGLKRLSQVLKYASTIDIPDYDTNFHELRDHYDPNLVNKSKIIALVSLLKVEIEMLPDPDIARRLEKRLEKLEEEIKKPKPKWGIIIAGFFILVGFLADMKTLELAIYNRPYEITNTIIATLHEDGLVQKNKDMFELQAEGRHSDDAHKQLEPPPDVMPAKKEGE